jgi:hypothetical protein
MISKSVLLGFLGFLCLPAIACVSEETVGTAVLPDGSSVVVIRCSSDQAECFQRAGGECPSGYEIKNRETREGSRTGETATIAGSGNFAIAHASSTTVEMQGGTMLISCHGKSRATLEAEARAAHDAEYGDPRRHRRYDPPSEGNP